MTGAVRRARCAAVYAWVVALGTLSACRQRRAGMADVDGDGVHTPAAEHRDQRTANGEARVDPAPPPEPEPAWCFRPGERVDLRGIDRAGHVLAARGRELRDETAGGAVELLDPMTPCRWRGSYFGTAADGRAMMVHQGRLYLRAALARRWTATPICTDAGGAPVAPRTNANGWAVVARRGSGEPGMLLTNESAGVFGWFALFAMDATLTDVVIEGDASFLALVSGGHMIVVDRTRTVAGAVLPAAHATFDGMTRTTHGVVAYRDLGPGSREMVVGDGVQATFRRVQCTRPAGGRTLRVFASSLGRMVAVTDRGVELARDPARGFVRVFDWSSIAQVADGGDRIDRASVTFGFLANGRPALAMPDGVVTADCPGP